MKATEAKLLDFIKKSPQFVIPIYQRTYSWTDKECKQLWDDIIRTGADNRLLAHFVGSIVYIEKGLYQVTGHSPLLVIDGQQRLTTVTLLIAALTSALKDEEPVDGFSARKLRNYYLLNPEETDDRRFKLLLSQTDRSSLIAIVGDSELPKDFSIRITANFKYFKSLIEDQNSKLTDLCKGLAKLIIVDVALNRDQDNPQLIFESMNSTGRELSQADLIRNFILMGLETNLQTRLYEQLWRHMETDFGQEAYATYFDGFMRDFLTAKTGVIPTLRDVYETFKGYARREVSETGVESLVKEIREYAKHFCAIALGAEAEPRLKMAFQDLRELKIDVANPFLLELYRDYVSGNLPIADFVCVVRLVESYLFRRAVCAIPANSMNKTFATLTRAYLKDRNIQNSYIHLASLPSYRRFPNDEEFRRDLQTRDLFNFRNKAYWMRRFENHDRKERVAFDQCSVEHIMPQNDKPSAEWKAELGPDWQRIRQTWLHTLGNLTLTAYNSEYSDRPFSEKRDMQNGFKESPIKLNAGLGLVQKWDENAIKVRAERLAEKALDVWPFPQVSQKEMKAFQLKTDTAVYGIENHPGLLESGVREIFEALRKEILGLDPCITEEYMRRSVSYKAESSFADLSPKGDILRVHLNSLFCDIDDPRGICKDYTNKGHAWGTGDVRIRLKSVEDIPYVMGLVRQAFDQQMSRDDSVST